MRFHHANRFTRLHQQRFIRFETLECIQDGVERFPRTRGLTAAAVDNELLRMLRDLRIEIVQQHPQGSFGLPGPAGLL